MKVLVDENIPLITVEELRLKGFDVIDTIYNFLKFQIMLELQLDLWQIKS